MAKRRRGYQFTERMDSKWGIVAFVLSIAAIFFLTMGFKSSMAGKGNGGPIVGLFGVLGIITAAQGIYLGIKGIKLKERHYVFSWAGTVINGCTCLFMVVLFVIGLIGV